MAVLEIQNFRNKYPEYSDISDEDLATKLAAKYPDSYSDLPAKVIPSVAQSEEQKIRVERENPINIAGQATKLAGLHLLGSGIATSQKVSEMLHHPLATAAAAGGTVVGGVEKLIPGEQPQEHYFNDAAKYVTDRYGSPKKFFDTLGNDPFGTALDLAPVGKGVGDLISKVPVGATNVGRVATMADVGNLSQDVGQLQAMDAKLGNVPVGGGKAINTSSRGDIAQGMSNADKTIYALYNASVGAKIKNAGTDVNNFKVNRVNAINTIAENLPDIKLTDGEGAPVLDNSGNPVIVPTNRFQLLQALNQAKQLVWNKVSALSGGATKAGATIDISKIADQAFDDVKEAYGPDTFTANPGLLDKLTAMRDQIKQIGTSDPTKVQAYMKYLNSQLTALRKTGDATDYTVKDLYSSMMPKLNDAMDTAIEKTLSDPQYSAYRKQYSSLKSAENEVLASANKFNKSTAGQGGGIVHPLVNLWSLEELLMGGAQSLSGNVPGALHSAGRAVLLKVSSALLDWAKNPDIKVTKMFDIAKKEIGKRTPAPDYSNPAIESLSQNAESSNPRLIPQGNPLKLPAPQAPEPPLPQYLIDRQNIPQEPIPLRRPDKPYIPSGQAEITGPNAQQINKEKFLAKRRELLKRRNK